MKYNDSISFGQICVFLRKVCFKLQKISVRSQKWCLTIPKMLPDNELSIISTHSYCQATLLGLFLRSQKLYLTIKCPSSLLKTIVRQNFWDILWDPKNYAWQLAVQDMSRVDGVDGVVRHNFWDPRNDAWRLSGNIFGIIRHHYWDLTLIFRVQKEAKTGYVNLFYRSQHSYHLNHLFKERCKYLLNASLSQLHDKALAHWTWI